MRRVLLPKCDRRVTKSQRSRFFSILLKKEPSRPVTFAISSLVSPDLFSDNNLTIDIICIGIAEQGIVQFVEFPFEMGSICSCAASDILPSHAG